MLIALGEETTRVLLDLPETGPGFQLVRRGEVSEGEVWLVVNAETALVLDSVRDISRESDAVFRNGVQALAGLESSTTIVAAPQPTQFLLLSPRIPKTLPVSATSPVPLITPSTLAKHQTLSKPRQFHRFSPFNPDRRVDPSTGDFLPGTYAVPESELPFCQTGFAAVGRLALPSVMPASFQYIATAAVGTNVAFGTVAPAFGQAGGGVEAFLAHGAKNVRPRSVPAKRIPDE